MALDTNALHISGVAHIYLATVGTAQPTTPAVDPPVAFASVGHTSFADGITISPQVTRDLKKTHQAPAGAREVVTDYSIQIKATLHQVDAANLELYFGGTREADGTFWVPKAGATTEKALYIRSIDGTSVVPIYAPRVSVASDGDLVLKPGDLTPLPVVLTILDQASATGLLHLL